MKKKYLFTTALILSLSASFPAFAGNWLLGQDGKEVRWCYDNGDGTHACNEWKWIDGDGNGISECYCFDANGWLLTNTITPDGYTVDSNGAWCIDGIVQTKSTALTPSSDSIQQVIGWELTADGNWKYYTAGKYLTSQWRKISSKRYYFNEDSIMVTGFQEIDGDLYYFTASGALKTKNFTLDGTRYIVDEDGIIIDEYETDADENTTTKSSSSSSKTDSSSASSSSGGPSSDSSSATDSSSYQKPDYSSSSKQEPDSDYRQSSADKYIFTEDA